MSKHLGLAGLALVASAIAFAAPQDPPRKTPRELGTVAWKRGFDAVLAESRASEKPVFALFQEVPGCATCVSFGEGALSHPLLVEAIETEFVPTLVYNNKGGEDARLLERFGEPSWNNPVVRFLDGDGRDVVPRRDRVYTEAALARRMREALAAAGRTPPVYLDWIDANARTPRERVTLETHCFWEGEACIGGHPAVTSTRASWDGGAEVVEVWFDPSAASAGELLAWAHRRGCGEKVVLHDESQRAAAVASYGEAVRVSSTPPTPSKASDQKRHLRHSALRALPLTRFQQTRVNAALAQGEDPRPWLSPRQRAALE